MARRPRVFAPGVLYHVIVRGNQRQKTFTSDGDYQAYLERMAKYRRQYGYMIYAFCLMSNITRPLAGSELGNAPGQIHAGSTAILYPVF